MRTVPRFRPNAAAARCPVGRGAANCGGCARPPRLALRRHPTGHGRVDWTKSTVTLGCLRGSLRGLHGAARRCAGLAFAEASSLPPRPCRPRGGGGGGGTLSLRASTARAPSPPRPKLSTELLMPEVSLAGHKLELADVPAGPAPTASIGVHHHLADASDLGGTARCGLSRLANGITAPPAAFVFAPAVAFHDS